MQEKRLWLVLLLMSFYVSAQTKGVVVDKSGKPILYVNIWVENGVNYNQKTTPGNYCKFKLLNPQLHESFPTKL